MFKLSSARIGGTIGLLIGIVVVNSMFAYEGNNLFLDLGVEVKAHIRDSESNRFTLPFPPGAALETVDEGTHFEISTLRFLADMSYMDWVVSKLRVDVIDLHDRNTTSNDKKVDFDEYWFRFGNEITPGRLPIADGRNLYLKIGKFGKFERQTDRHLESYGLAATAFNRFEDLGVEAGLDLTPNIYVKGSITSGNPVFMRDPNALAGDNGTKELILHQNPDVKNGFPIFYDAEVEDLVFNQEFMEGGLGAGFRYGNEAASRSVDLMIFGYERDLKDSADLKGTRYGGDLDLFTLTTAELPELAANSVLNDLKSDYKREYGVNLWVYFDEWTLFGQYVEQDIGGLDRKGWDLELSYRFFLPQIWMVGDSQLFSTVAPAVRYSFLNPNFAGASGPYPAPSVFWEWEKIDLGVRIGILAGLNLTVEYNLNELETARGDQDNDEFLTTLNWRYFF